MSEHKNYSDLEHLKAILSGNTEPTMRNIKLDAQQAQEMYKYLHAPSGLFHGILKRLWNQARTNSHFVNEHGYVRVQVAQETSAGTFTVALNGNVDESPFRPYGNWSVDNVDHKNQPDGLLYDLTLIYPSRYRDEAIGITKDNQIIFTGSKSIILIDGPDKLNADASMGHYTPVSMLHTIGEYYLLKPLQELVSGTLN